MPGRVQWLGSNTQKLCIKQRTRGEDIKCPKVGLHLGEYSLGIWSSHFVPGTLNLGHQAIFYVCHCEALPLQFCNGSLNRPETLPHSSNLTESIGGWFMCETFDYNVTFGSFTIEIRPPPAPSRSINTCSQLYCIWWRNHSMAVISYKANLFAWQLWKCRTWDWNKLLYVGEQTTCVDHEDLKLHTWAFKREKNYSHCNEKHSEVWA